MCAQPVRMETGSKRLIDRLPPVRGRLIADTPLAPASWFRVGGQADILFLPHDTDDLRQFLAQTPIDIPVHILGAASNSLIRDGGLAGVTIRLMGANWGQMQTDSNRQLQIGAGALNRKVTEFAAREGLAGLEFLFGIPGMIGGAIVMNAGCHGRETKDVLVSANGIDRHGQKITLNPEQLAFSYRHAQIPEGVIITSVRLQASCDAPQVIAGRMDELRRQREDSQPLRERTGGSTFTNPDPPGTPDQRKAWRLLDAAGMRGKRCGGAQFSEKHCNFLLNTGNATAGDLETLGELARTRVKAQCGVELRWEIRRMGRLL